MRWLSESELDQLLEPSSHLGSTQTMIDAVLTSDQAVRDEA